MVGNSARIRSSRRSAARVRAASRATTPPAAGEQDECDGEDRSDRPTGPEQTGRTSRPPPAATEPHTTCSARNARRPARGRPARAAAGPRWRRRAPARRPAAASAITGLSSRSTTGNGVRSGARRPADDSGEACPAGTARAGRPGSAAGPTAPEARSASSPRPQHKAQDGAGPAVRPRHRSTRCSSGSRPIRIMIR